MDSVHSVRRRFPTVSVLVPGVCGVLLAAALVLPMPTAFAQATGGTGTEPCTQNPGSQDIACGTGSSASNAGQPGPNQPGWTSSAGGAGGTGNTAIGNGAQSGNGGTGANGTAGGNGGVGGTGGSRNIAIGQNSQAG